MADFLIAVNKTLEYEGGLVDDPGDPGGLTNFGISSKAHPTLSPNQIRSMTRDDAIRIYLAEYWPARYTQIQDQVIANVLFDFGVTSGVKMAVGVLQRALFGSGGPIDGDFGENTLYNLNRASARALRVKYTSARLQFYAGLGKPQFLNSWFFRTIDIVMP